MRIVVLDGYPLDPGDNPWDAIAALGDLRVYDRTPPAAVCERAREADILLVNKVRLPAEVIEALPNVRYIGVLATGHDVVDGAAAARRNIPVCNVVAYGTESVAQHVMALLLELCRRVGDHSDSVLDGQWGETPEWCYWRTPQRELTGLTMGIAGFGTIGRRVGELARAFGMRVVAHTRSPQNAPNWPDFAFVDRETLFREADVVSLHCPLQPETRHMVNAATLALMRPGGFIINTGRGPLVDDAALIAALTSGHLAGYAADVLAVEPPPPHHPLLAAPGVIITPHLAWASLTARRNIITLMADNIRAFLAGTPKNVVNGV